MINHARMVFFTGFQDYVSRDGTKTLGFPEITALGQRWVTLHDSSGPSSEDGQAAVSCIRGFFLGSTCGQHRGQTTVASSGFAADWLRHGCSFFQLVSCDGFTGAPGSHDTVPLKVCGGIKKVNCKSSGTPSQQQGLV